MISKYRPKGGPKSPTMWLSLPLPDALPIAEAVSPSIQACGNLRVDIARRLVQVSGQEQHAFKVSAKRRAKIAQNVAMSTGPKRSTFCRSSFAKHPGLWKLAC